MESICVTLPREIPNCPIAQDNVVDAVRTVCGHFFERENFQQYLEIGGRDCPVCKVAITSYGEVPSNQWGQEVELRSIGVEGEHRVQSDHSEQGFDSEGARIFILIARAMNDTQFEAWCRSKDPAATEQMDLEAVLIQEKIARLQRYPQLLKQLFNSYCYEDEPSIQSFISRFVDEGTNLQLLSFLCHQVNLDCAFEGAHNLMGGKGKKPPFDEKEAIKQAEKERKICALVGLILALCLTAGTVRVLFSFFRCRKSPPLA